MSEPTPPANEPAPSFTWVIVLSLAGIVIATIVAIVLESFISTASAVTTGVIIGFVSPVLGAIVDVLHGQQSLHISLNSRLSQLLELTATAATQAERDRTATASPASPTKDPNQEVV